MLFRGGADYDVVRVASPRGLYLLVIYIEGLSELSEGSLPVEYNDGDIANISAFVMGMTNADFALIKRTLSNLSSLKYFNRALHRQLFMGTEVSGALGCTIDGAGSLYYAFYDNSLAADKTAAYFDEMLTSRDLKSNILVSRINNEGAVLV